MDRIKIKIVFSEGDSKLSEKKNTVKALSGALKI